MNYYNEIDPKACAWLRELMAEGLIPEGKIDERSITEVQPADLAGFTQCHFFTGIGGWSLALRLAGYPDDREVWTASCPCQPLSCAGQGKGDADERHLWPAFYRLYAERRPSVTFGEQVASKLGREWFSGIRADLEGMGSAVGGADLCAAGVRAPHIRQRLYWVAESDISRRQASERGDRLSQRDEPEQGRSRVGVGQADTQRAGLEKWASEPGNDGQEQPSTERGGDATCGVANDTSGGQRMHGCASGEPGHADECEEACGMGDPERDGRWTDEPGRGQEGRTAPGWNGEAIWHPCRDGKIRRIPKPCPESVLQRVVNGFSDDMDVVRAAGGFPLAAKIKGRAQLLKGYGNAICVPLAAEFIKAYMEL